MCKCHPIWKYVYCTYQRSQKGLRIFSKSRGVTFRTTKMYCILNFPRIIPLQNQNIFKTWKRVYKPIPKRAWCSQSLKDTKGDAPWLKNTIMQMQYREEVVRAWETRTAVKGGETATGWDIFLTCIKQDCSDKRV